MGAASRQHLDDRESELFFLCPQLGAARDRGPPLRRPLLERADLSFGHRDLRLGLRFVLGPKPECLSVPIDDLTLFEKIVLEPLLERAMLDLRAVLTLCLQH